MRLYTRSGDDGSTGLFGGGRVDKDHPRVDAYGCVDELNACIGWALCAAQPPHLTTGLPPAPPASSQTSNAMKTGVPSSNSNSSVEQSIRAILTTLQSRLFDLGADLATPLDSRHQSKIQRITADHVAQAERWIDEIDAANAPITNFILPGGTELAARLHLARTICRRAERAMVHLSHSDEINPQAIIYINRISDMLFAMARRANVAAGVADIPWVPTQP